MIEPSSPRRSTLITLAAGVVVLAALREAAAIVIPILLALFIAFVSSPMVFRLTRWKLPYSVSVGVVLVGELGVLVTLGTIVGQSGARFREHLPGYRERLIELYGETSHWLVEHRVPVASERMSEVLDPDAVMGVIGGTVARMGSLLTSTLLVVFVLAFTLLDASRLWRKIESRFAQTAGEHVLGRISSEVNRYLGVKTVTSGATGIAVGMWVGVMGVDFPVLWGLLGFLLNYVPTIGSLLAAIPPVLIALLMLGPWPAVAVAVGYLVVNLLIGNIIEPRVMGGALGLSPVVVFLSMVVWGWVLGPVGALLSVPLTMIFKIVLQHTDEWAWLADLMSGPQRGERQDVPVVDASGGADPRK